MRRLSAVDLVALLTPGVVDQNFSLSALHEHHKVGHQTHQNDDKEAHNDAHRTGSYQFKQSAHRIGQARRNACKNQNRDAVAQTTLGDLLAQPHQKHRPRRQAHHRGDPKTHPRGQHQTGRRLQRQGYAHGLEQSKTQSAITRVLGDLATTRFALFFDLLETGQHIRQELHDDRGRDVGHDPQSKNREARQGATREHIEQIQDAPLLTIEELLQGGGVNAWHRDVRPDAVHHQAEHQKHKPATQVTELVVLG